MSNKSSIAILLFMAMFLLGKTATHLYETNSKPFDARICASAIALDVLAVFAAIAIVALFISRQRESRNGIAPPIHKWRRVLLLIAAGAYSSEAIASLVRLVVGALRI
jgi:hypothetical protein